MAKQNESIVLSGDDLPFVRSALNYNTRMVSDATSLRCDDPSLTQQQFKEDQDINVIVDRWTKTGIVPGSRAQPEYGDFTGIGDYHSALNTVLEAEEGFMRMDAKIRAQFDNDPGRFLEFVQDPANKDKLYEIGIATKAQRTTTQAVDEMAAKLAEKLSPTSPTAPPANASKNAS